LVGQRGDNGQPFRQVVEGEADDECSTDSQRAQSVGRPDRQSLTKIVQADTDGDHQRQSPPIGGCLLTSLVAVEQAIDRTWMRNAKAAPSKTSNGPPNATPDQIGDRIFQVFMVKPPGW
jgi:hypothetical protein